jgi:hypothetical protein
VSFSQLEHGEAWFRARSESELCSRGQSRLDSEDVKLRSEKKFDVITCSH